MTANGRNFTFVINQQGCQLKLKKYSLKTPDFSKKSPKNFRLKIPKTHKIPQKMRQILRNICVYLVINNLKNRAEHVLGC
jgi:hypothetical protein